MPAECARRARTSNFTALSAPRASIYEVEMLARSGGIAACGLALALAGTARAHPHATQELEAIEPGLSDAYASALRALDDRRYGEASRKLAGVLEAAPRFAPAIERRCAAERALGHFERAIELCGRAVDAAPTPANLLALSHVLTLRGRDADLERARGLADRALAAAPRHRGALLQRLELAALEHDFDGAARIVDAAEASLPSAKASAARVLVAQLALEAGNPRDAVAHARRAVALDPESAGAHVVLARAAIEVGDDPAVRDAAHALLRLAPDAAYTQYVAGVAAVAEGRFDDARRHVERARALGMEPSSCDDLLAEIDRISPIAGGMLRPMSVALAVGSALFMALFTGAVAFGAATRRRLHATLGDLARFDRRGGRRLRVAYRRVLFAAIAYGYVFLPLMGALVAGAVAAALHAFLAAGTLRVGVAIVLLLVGGFFLLAVVEAAFLRPRERPPNEVVDFADNPKLHAVVRDVAARLGVRPAERVVATPGAEIAIVDQGTLAALLRFRGRRTLHLGVALVEAIDVQHLEVLLAHEYAHLRRAGTAGGALATSIDAALASMEQALRESGAATALNPAWLMLRLARKALGRAARGAVRFQEAYADTWTARTYGPERLESALRRAVAARARFEVHAYETLDEVVSTSRGLSNLYTYRTRRPPDEARIAEAIARRWNEPDRTSGRSAPAERIARLSRPELHVPAEPPRAADEASAWTLFTAREALETSMTEALRNDLARRGVRVAEAEADEGDTPPEPRRAAVGE